MAGHIRTLGGTTRYRLVYVAGRQQLEHRVVLAQHLGRPLLSTEVVHHKDGDGLNNALENLELITQAEHRRRHGGPRRWDLQEALRMRAAGATFAVIAAHFKVTESALLVYFKRQGLPTTRAPRALKFDRAEAFRLFRAGTSVAAIARTLGVKPPSVHKALVRAGLL